MREFRFRRHELSVVQFVVYSQLVPWEGQRVMRFFFAVIPIAISCVSVLSASSPLTIVSLSGEAPKQSLDHYIS